MGLHAFESETQHCQLYREVMGSRLPKLHGIEGRWNMPATPMRSALGDHAHFAGVDHYVRTYHVGGAATRRLDGDQNRTIAGRGALSLQCPGSDGTFASQGVVDYGRFYFRQSLLCEIADGAGFSEVAERMDFFAPFDRECASDADIYLRRAADCGEPPTAMEMDSRAYLLALSLLRAVRKRHGLSGEMDRRASRADLRRVLKALEERLGEPLRLSDLAESAGMSPFYFTRVFKSEVGLSPARFLMRRRTERAVELLRNGHLVLADIAYRIGFSSQSHMTRRVKEATGATPTEIRGGPCARILRRRRLIRTRDNCPKGTLQGVGNISSESIG